MLSSSQGSQRDAGSEWVDSFLDIIGKTKANFQENNRRKIRFHTCQEWLFGNTLNNFRRLFFSQLIQGAPMDENDSRKKEETEN